MRAFTPAERRGALAIAALLALGAAHDLHRARHPRWAPPAAPRAAAPARPAASDSAAAPGPSARPAAGPIASIVDLNQADAAALDALPGIGPVLARRILEHRDRHGPFRDPRELLAVRGVGPRLLERLDGRLRAGAPDTAARPR